MRIESNPTKLKNMYEKITDTIYEKSRDDILLEIMCEYGFKIEGFDWNRKKEQLLEFANKNQSLSILDNLEGIEWNEEEINEILKIAKNYNGGIELIKGIDWNQKKEELLEIAKKRQDLRILRILEGITWTEEEINEILKIEENYDGGIELIKGIDWNQKKEELLEIAKKRQELSILRELEGITWTEEEINEILKIAENYDGRIELIVGIDWNQKKEELLEIAKKKQDLRILRDLEGIIWTEEEINKILKIEENYKYNGGIEVIKGIDWNQQKEKLLGIAKKKQSLSILRFLEGIIWTEEEINEILKIEENDKYNSQISDITLIKGIDWNQQKEKLLGIAKRKQNLRILRNLEGITWTKEEINEILKIEENYNYNGRIELIKGIDWNQQKEKLLEIAKKKQDLRILRDLEGIIWTEKEINEMLKIEENYDGGIELIKGIDWNQQKEKLLGVAKKRQDLRILRILEGITWTEEEINEILKIAENDDGGIRLIKGIDWNQKKEELLEIAKKKQNLRILGILEGITWTEEEINEILKIEENYNYKGGIELIKGIDWNQQKEKLLGIAKKKQDLRILRDLEGITWTEEEINQALKSMKVFKSRDFQIPGITYSKEQLDAIIEKAIKNRDIDLYNRIIRIKEQNNPIYTENLKDFAHVRFPSFDKKMISNLTDTEKSDISLNRLKDNREFILNILESFNEIGVLQDLVDSENKNVERINILLKDENKFEKLNCEDVKKYIQNLDLNSQKDALEFEIFSRQILNKWAHNIESYICANMIYNFSKEDETAQCREKINEILNSCKDGNIITNKEEFLKQIRKLANEYNHNWNNRSIRTITGMINARIPPIEDIKAFIFDNINDKRTGKTGNLEEKTDDEKYDICSKYLRNFDSISREYYNALDMEQNNEIIPYTFSEYINRFLENKEEIIKISEHLKNKNSQKITDKLEEFFEKVRKERNFETEKIEEIFKYSAKYIDFNKTCFDTKHVTSSIVFEAVKEMPQFIYMENLSPQTETPGVLDIYLQDHIQVFGGHYSSDDEEASIEDISSFPPPNPDIDKAFKSNLLRTFIPMGKITEDQKQNFKQLEQTIRFLEGKQLEDPQKPKNEYEKINELEEIKNTSNSEYNAFKIKILLGAGLDRYRDYYNIPIRANSNKSLNISIDNDKKILIDTLINLGKTPADIKGLGLTNECYQYAINKTGQTNSQVVQTPTNAQNISQAMLATAISITTNANISQERKVQQSLQQSKEESKEGN